MARKRRSGPRHKYSPEEVVYRILNDEKLFRICEIVFESDGLIHATDISRKLHGISVGYAYLLLKKLEKWNVVRGVKDPVNGKLAFRSADTKVAELLAEEIKRRKVKKLVEAIESVIMHSMVKL